MKSEDIRPENLQRGMRLQLHVQDLVYGGKGLAKLEDFVVFVQNAIPGDLVLAEITKRQKNHAEAIAREILQPSPMRIPARCPLFGTCAGCSMQSLRYADQLLHKQTMVESLVQHLGKAIPEKILPILPSPLQWRYRNKMEYTFGSNGDGDAILGFHYPGSFDRVFEVKECFLQPEPMDAILAAVTDWVRAHQLHAYDPRVHKGFLRHLILRHSKASGEILAVLLTSPGILPAPESLFEHLKSACPSLAGLIWGVNGGEADVARMDQKMWSAGAEMLEETLGGLRFRISPFSFFQVNLSAAEILYQTIRDMLGEEAAAMRLLDAYCGTGTIGIFCASRVHDIIGIDVVREAIWDARENAAQNNAGNCTFIAGDMRRSLPLATSMPGPAIQSIIVDPPRGGMDKHSLRALLALCAPVFIYVSCNPATLARDLVTIREAGYRAETLQPVDLFPQTYHVEAVVRFIH